MRHETIEMVCAHVGQGRKPPPHHKGCIRGFRPKIGLIDLSKFGGTIGPLGTPCSDRLVMVKRTATILSLLLLPATLVCLLSRRLLLVSGSGAGGAPPCGAVENCPAEAAPPAARRHFPTRNCAIKIPSLICQQRYGSSALKTFEVSSHYQQ